MRIMKFTVGIRPSQKMFRVSSLHGSLVDSVLSLRGSNSMDDEYYTEISRGADQGFIQLRNEDRGNTLRIDLDNVTFGVFQGSCRVNRFHYAASEASNAGRSGFSMTAPIGSQFRVFPDHRSGRFAFAAA